MSRNEKLIFFTLILFTLSVRIALIEQKNLWFDEIYSWHITQGSISEIVKDTSADIHPPFYYFVLKIWNMVFGDSVFSMRILSVCFSVISVIVLFFLCLKITSIRNAFIIMFLFAISPLNLFYSQEVRMASLNLLLNILAVYSVIRIKDASLTKNIIKEKFTYLFIVSSVLACYTHYFSIPILAANSVWLLFSLYKNIKAVIIIIVSDVLIIFAFLPWFPIMLSQASRGQQWRVEQDIYLIVKEVLNFVRDAAMGLYYSSTPSWILWIITILLLLMISVSFFITIRNFKLLGNNYSLILLVFGLTLLTAVLVASKQRIEFFRYLSILVPYIVIILVLAFSSIKRDKLLIFTIIIFSLINLYGIYKYFKADYKNNDYRGILTEININIAEGEKIFTEPHYCGWIVDYYSKKGFENVPGTINYGWGINMMVDTITFKQPKRFFLVVDYCTLDTTGYKKAINQLTNNYKLVYLKRFNIIPREVDLYRFVKY